MRFAMLVAAASVMVVSAVHGEDEIHLKQGKGDKSPPVIRATFDGVKDGILKYHFPSDAGSGVSGSFNAFALRSASGVAPVQASRLLSITFDGERDWLSVTMKNGDFVRGEAESVKSGILRLKGVDKPIRLLNVKEIVATDPPKEGDDQ